MTVNTAGATTFGGVVGGVAALTSVTTDAAGTVAINGAAVTTTGTQTYNEDATLGADTVLTGTTVTFNGNLNAAAAGVQSLTITGAAVLGNAVGDVVGATALEFLTVTGVSTITSGAVTTVGNQTYTGTITLGATTTLTGTGAASVISSSALAPASLTVIGAGNSLTTLFNGVTVVIADQFTGLNNLSIRNGPAVTSLTQITGNLTVTGNMTFDRLVLTGDVVARSTTSGTFNFGSAASANPQILTVFANATSIIGMVNNLVNFVFNTDNTGVFVKNQAPGSTGLMNSVDAQSKVPHMGVPEFRPGETVFTPEFFDLFDNVGLQAIPGTIRSIEQFKKKRK